MFIDKRRALAQLGINPDEIGQFINMKAGDVQVIVGSPNDQTTPELRSDANRRAQRIQAAICIA
jgi:hypothetical protein